MRYILHVDNLVNFIVIEIMMCSLIIILIRKNNFLNERLNYFKIIFYVLLADFIMICMSEGFYGVMMSKVLNLSITQINNNIWLNIMLSIVPRLIQVSLILTFLYNERVKNKINYLELILKEKILSVSLIIFLTTLIIVYFKVANYIMDNNILENGTIISQAIIIVILLSVPIVLILTYIIPISYMLYKEIKTNEKYENMINTM
jgi:hypothetical protein